MNIIKIILIATILLSVISCANSPKQEALNLKIENYIDSVQRKFPGFNANSAIKDELNEFLRKDFQNAVNIGVLTDLPFKLEKVEKCGGRYILELSHSLSSKRYNTGVLGDLEINLYAITDEKIAKSLIEEQFYLVNVSFKEYITLQNKDKYCALVLMSPFMGFFDNEIQFGAIAVHLKNIEIYSK